MLIYSKTNLLILCCARVNKEPENRFCWLCAETFQWSCRNFRISLVNLCKFRINIRWLFYGGFLKDLVLSGISWDRLLLCYFILFLWASIILLVIFWYLSLFFTCLLSNSSCCLRTWSRTHMMMSFFVNILSCTTIILRLLFCRNLAVITWY